MWNLFKINTETPERHKSRRFGVFINFEQIVHTVLVFPLLNLNRLEQFSKYFVLMLTLKRYPQI